MSAASCTGGSGGVKRGGWAVNHQPPWRFVQGVVGSSWPARGEFRAGPADFSEHATVAGRVVRVIADRSFETGRHAFSWDGTDGEGASGAYLVRATTTGGGAEARTLVVLR